MQAKQAVMINLNDYPELQAALQSKSREGDLEKATTFHQNPLKENSWEENWEKEWENRWNGGWSFDTPTKE